MPRGSAQTVRRRIRRAQRSRRVLPSQDSADVPAAMTEFAAELEQHHETSPRLTGGDLDLAVVGSVDVEAGVVAVGTLDGAV